MLTLRNRLRLHSAGGRSQAARRQKWQALRMLFTLDDGYRDNATFAADIFARHRAPFTIFLNSGFFGRTCTMWWETLDAVLNQS